MDKFPPRVWLRPFGVPTGYNQPQGFAYHLVEQSKYTFPVYISMEEHETIVNKLAKDRAAIIEYCKPHLHHMWAAMVCSIILGCDFRDVKDHIGDESEVKHE